MSKTVHNPAAVAFHDDHASRWEDGYRFKATFGARPDVLSTLLPENLGGQAWLDAGCGTGTLSRWLAERGASVTGMDGSQEMLANAVPTGNVQYLAGDLLQTGLSDAAFDGIICSSVLEYLPAPQLAIGEFHRILKPGGTLIASVPNSALVARAPLLAVYWLTRLFGRYRLFAYLDHSKHCYSAEQFGKLLRKNGFVPERSIEYGGLGLPLGVNGRHCQLLMARARRS